MVGSYPTMDDDHNNVPVAQVWMEAEPVEVETESSHVNAGISKNGGASLQLKLQHEEDMENPGNRKKIGNGFAANDDDSLSELRNESVGKIRCYSILAVLSTCMACISYGTIYSPPIDAFFSIVLYILITRSTGRSGSTLREQMLSVTNQYGCCGFRHVYGICTATIFFLVCLSCGRLVASILVVRQPFNASGFSLPSYNQYERFYRDILALQSAATIGTGLGVFFLIRIASLSSPTTRGSCFHSEENILIDPFILKQAPRTRTPTRRCCVMSKSPGLNFKISIFIIFAATLGIFIRLFVLQSNKLSREEYCDILQDELYTDEMVKYYADSGCCTEEVAATRFTLVYQGINSAPAATTSYFDCGCASPTDSEFNGLVCSGNFNTIYSTCAEISDFECPDEVTIDVPKRNGQEWPDTANLLDNSWIEIFTNRLSRPYCVVSEQCQAPDVFLIAGRFTFSRYFRDGIKSFQTRPCDSSQYTILSKRDIRMKKCLLVEYL